MEDLQGQTLVCPTAQHLDRLVVPVVDDDHPPPESPLCETLFEMFGEEHH
jgi:hypothetical protein